MDPASIPALRNAAWFLLVGAALGFVGACTPPYRQWSAPLEEGLRVIATHPIGWRLIHLGFITGIWLIVVGLATLTHATRDTPHFSLALATTILMALAALCWSANIADRLGPLVTTANQLLARGSLPTGVTNWGPTQRLLFVGFSLLGYLAVALSGWWALRSGLAPRGLAWTLVAWGLTGGFVVGMNVPVVVYIPFGVLAVYLLRG